MSFKYYPFIPGHEILGEFFSCGVQLFIFISGYLYGGKVIEDFNSWYLKRIIKVSLPAIILSVFIIILSLTMKEYLSYTTIVAYLLDAEGLLFVCHFFRFIFDEIDCLGPLWFTTVIMLCYLLVPFLQKITLRIQRIRLFTILTYIFGIIATIVLSKYISISYFLLFAIGYCLGKIKWLDMIDFKIFIIHTVLFVFLLIGRIIVHKYYDGTLLYLQFISFCSFFIGTWFITALSYVQKKNIKLISNISDNAVVKTLDKYSFYVYLVHGVLCMGVFNVYEHMPLPAATFVFVIGTIVLSFLLKNISETAQNFILKRSNQIFKNTNNS